jgi:hypothetical protein
MRRQCEGITKAARVCKRPATIRWVGHARDRYYCSQHSGGAGVMRLLRPLPWETERIEPIWADGLTVDAPKG